MQGQLNLQSRFLQSAWNAGGWHVSWIGSHAEQDRSVASSRLVNGASALSARLQMPSYQKDTNSMRLGVTICLTGLLTLWVHLGLVAGLYVYVMAIWEPSMMGRSNGSFGHSRKGWAGSLHPEGHGSHYHEAFALARDPY